MNTEKTMAEQQELELVEYMTKGEYASDEPGVVKEAEHANTAQGCNDALALGGKAPSYYASAESVQAVDGKATAAQKSADDAQASAALAQAAANRAQSTADSMMVDASAHTIYVSGSGNDATGDGTQNNPYRQISKAFASIPWNWYGEVVIDVAGGVYYDAFEITDKNCACLRLVHSGSGDRSTCHKAVFRTHKMRIETNGIEFGGFDDSLPQALFCIGGGHVVLENAKILGPGKGTGTALYSDGSRVHVKNSDAIGRSKEAVVAARGGSITFGFKERTTTIQNCDIGLQAWYSGMILTSAEFVQNTAAQKFHKGYGGVILQDGVPV